MLTDLSQLRSLIVQNSYCLSGLDGYVIESFTPGLTGTAWSCLIFDLHDMEPSIEVYQLRVRWILLRNMKHELRGILQ